jgi:hypothetical protein
VIASELAVVVLIPSVLGRVVAPIGLITPTDTVIAGGAHWRPLAW